MLPTILGTTLHGKLQQYRWLADLIAFDGPLLSLYKDTSKDQDVLFSWLDCDNKCNRWCIIPVQRSDLIAYLSKEISLFRIFEKSENIIVFDSFDFERTNIKETSWKSLPGEYLPERDSFLDDIVSTEDAKRLAANLPQDYSIFLDGDLYLDDLAGIPKLVSAPNRWGDYCH